MGISFQIHTPAQLKDEIRKRNIQDVKSNKFSSKKAQRVHFEGLDDTAHMIAGKLLSADKKVGMYDKMTCVVVPLLGTNKRLVLNIRSFADRMYQKKETQEKGAFKQASSDLKKAESSLNDAIKAEAEAQKKLNKLEREQPSTEAAKLRHDDKEALARGQLLKAHLAIEEAQENYDKAVSKVNQEITKVVQKRVNEVHKVWQRNVQEAFKAKKKLLEEFKYQKGIETARQLAALSAQQETQRISGPTVGEPETPAASATASQAIIGSFLPGSQIAQILTPEDCQQLAAAQAEEAKAKDLAKGDNVIKKLLNAVSDAKAAMLANVLERSQSLSPRERQVVQFAVATAALSGSLLLMSRLGLTPSNIFGNLTTYLAAFTAAATAKLGGAAADPQGFINMCTTTLKENLTVPANLTVPGEEVLEEAARAMSDLASKAPETVFKGLKEVAPQVTFMGMVSGAAEWVRTQAGKVLSGGQPAEQAQPELGALEIEKEEEFPVGRARLPGEGPMPEIPDEPPPNIPEEPRIDLDDIRPDVPAPHQHQVEDLIKAEAAGYKVDVVKRKVDLPTLKQLDQVMASFKLEAAKNKIAEFQQLENSGDQDVKKAAKACREFVEGFVSQIEKEEAIVRKGFNARATTDDQIDQYDAWSELNTLASTQATNERMKAYNALKNALTVAQEAEKRAGAKEEKASSLLRMHLKAMGETVSDDDAGAPLK